MSESERDPRHLLALRLNEQYPNDVGIIVSFLLNYITLKPGESLILQPNEPHAYLSGEGIECMATSDNVVRGGLTPKLKDAKILVDMLTYNTGDITPYTGEIIGEGGSSAKMYTSGFKEFNVIRVKFDANVSEF